MAPPTTGRKCLPPCLSPDPPVPVSCLHDAPSPPIGLAAPASAPGPLPRSTIPPAMPPLSHGGSCRAPPRALSAHRRCHRTGSGSLPAGAGHQRCQVRALACASAARAPAVSSGASRAAYFKTTTPRCHPCCREAVVPLKRAVVEEMLLDALTDRCVFLLCRQRGKLERPASCSTDVLASRLGWLLALLVLCFCSAALSPWPLYRPCQSVHTAGWGCRGPESCQPCSAGSPLKPGMQPAAG